MAIVIFVIPSTKRLHNSHDYGKIHHAMNGKTHYFYGDLVGLPSGKHTTNYGKSPFLTGKLTISIPMFNSKLL